MFFHNLAHNVKTDTLALCRRARLVFGVELIEHERQTFLGYADAVIFDVQHEFHSPLLCADFHNGFFGRVLDGVGHEILHDSFHLTLVRSDRNVRDFADLHRNAFRVGKRTQFLDDFSKQRPCVCLRFMFGLLFDFGV